MPLLLQQNRLFVQRVCSSQTIAPKLLFALPSHLLLQRQQRLWTLNHKVSNEILPLLGNTQRFQTQTIYCCCCCCCIRPCFIRRAAGTRSYFSFRPPQDSNGRNPQFGPSGGGPLWWVRPAAYTAGGVALVVFAWPLLRFVVIGGLAYGAYRLAKVWWALRELNREIGLYSAGSPFYKNAEGKQQQQQGPLESILSSVFGSMFSSMGARASLRSVRSMSRVAEASIRAALSDRSNHRVVDIFTESIGESLNSVDLQDAIELGKPMETQMQSVNVNGKQRSHIEAVFPLYIDDAATTMFAHVTASEDALDEGTVFVESVFLLARMPSGQVAELAIDVCEQDGSNKDRDGFNQGTRTKVQDAEYKDV